MPSGSRAQRDKHWVDNRFGDTDDVSTLLLDRKAGANLLTKESLLEVFDVYDKVMSISNGAKRGYDERSCAKAYWDLAEPCQKSGVLAFWNWDRAALEADDDVLATLNAPARDCCSPRGRETNLEDVAGPSGYRRRSRRRRGRETRIVAAAPRAGDAEAAPRLGTATGSLPSQVASKLTRDESGRIVAAGALSLDFYLRARNHDKTGSDPHNRRLEKKFDRLRRQGGWVYFRKPIPLTREGQIQNVSGAFDRDQLLVNFAFVIIFLYALRVRASTVRTGSKDLISTQVRVLGAPRPQGPLPLAGLARSRRRARRALGRRRGLRPRALVRDGVLGDGVHRHLPRSWYRPGRRFRHLRRRVEPPRRLCA